MSSKAKTPQQIAAEFAAMTPHMSAEALLMQGAILRGANMVLDALIQLGAEEIPRAYLAEVLAANQRLAEINEAAAARRGIPITEPEA